MSDIDTAEMQQEPRLITETGIDRRVADIIEPVLIPMGYQLVRVRLSAQNGATLQIMAERTDGTMTVEDCETVSTAISPVLDVDDPIGKAYHLEVSSPGIDRPMVRKGDFVRWTGHLVKCETSVLVESRKRFRGVIRSADADGFTIERDQPGPDEAPMVTVPFSALAEAKLILTDDLIRDALTADKKAKAAREAANENFEDIDGDDETPSQQ
ncbi:ribosome maturation factor RimP [Rhizobium sp. Leaf384]|uniref:ribosome maturation factor RimP n=1 Tax=unclassified Rhizobium TaxID=2613769 RepID=UPI00071579A0|nr:MULTISPECIES: ribosome maturation factor RimP [unclassified Rhizobium]KQR78011.1 ribosome maturation factor RimP [Rhizobium sp. Leaf341]KQS81224.1 ribosome maturation factor RimP [Rhizobium sp. Leaf384]KQS87133.1 ribosome maturation factor RimP [Rhizobium sp. Leaf383]